MFYYVYWGLNVLLRLWSLYVLLRLWCLGVCMVYYDYGVWESVCYITSIGVCMFYYVYGVLEFVWSITSMVSGSLYVLLRLWCLGVCIIDVIEHTDSQTP
jgi:hypothetical protein